jgi:hypothetical protein
MPQPSSITRTSEIPPRRIAISMLRAPASRLFSTVPLRLTPGVPPLRRPPPGWPRSQKAIGSGPCDLSVLDCPAKLQAPSTMIQRNLKFQHQTRAIVIQSEAKDLWHCLSNSGVKSEMFRFTQHDTMATAVFFLVEISLELGRGVWLFTTAFLTWMPRSPIFESDD